MERRAVHTGLDRGSARLQVPYDPNKYNLLKEVTRNGAIVSRYTYTAAGAVDTVRIGNFAEFSRHFADSMGRDTAVVDQLGHRTRYLHDATTGNLKQVVRDGGQVTSFVFDGAGRDSLTVSPTSDTTRFVYDPMNRVTATYDAVNPNPTRTHYGPIYPDSLTDPKGERYRFVHNALGWVTQRYGPASAAVADEYGFDAAGNLVRSTNRNGQTIEYTLDLLGRTTAVAAPGATLQFGYDPSGQDRFMWGKNAWSTDTTWFTAWGAVDSTKADRGPGAIYGVGYDYAHWSGQATAIRDGYNTRTLSMRFNDQGQLDTLIVRGRKTYVSLRNSDRQTLTRVYPAAFNQTLEYTTDHRRADIQWGSLVTRGLGFDPSGRVTDLDPEGPATNKFEYDKLGRLIQRKVYDMFCYYFRVRYYDPAVGRFLSEDPLGLGAGLNPYAYGANNPVAQRDPYGLDPCTDPATYWECNNLPPICVGAGCDDENAPSYTDEQIGLVMDDPFLRGLLERAGGSGDWFSQDWDWVNPTGGSVRGCDAWGCGYFGASRGFRTHGGTDYRGVIPGQNVAAPATGVVQRFGYPYADDLSYRLIVLTTGNGYEVKLFYVQPLPGLKASDSVRAGAVIGTLQSLQRRYPGIADHVHVEVRGRGGPVNPGTLIP